MSDHLDELLGIDLNDPMARLARALVEEDVNLLEILVHARKRSGLTQREVAKRMDTSQSTVSEIENGRLDVRLSTIRRYAMAVGVFVRHEVEIEPQVGPCARCGKDPAAGFASITNSTAGERWYCHGDDDESPTCYELAMRGI